MESPAASVRKIPYKSQSFDTDLETMQPFSTDRPFPLVQGSPSEDAANARAF
jgi:hypothetical protein